MDLEFPNPINAERRLSDWPPKHDIGLYLSVGDTLMLAGTAAGHEDLRTLFLALAHEWERLAKEDPHWFFEDIT